MFIIRWLTTIVVLIISAIFVNFFDASGSVEHQTMALALSYSTAVTLMYWFNGLDEE